MLGRSNNVRLLWVRAHVEIRGNEKAHFPTKQETLIPNPTVMVTSPWSGVLAGIRRRTSEARSRLLMEGRTCRQTKLCPVYKWNTELLRLPKSDVRAVVG